MKRLGIVIPLVLFIATTVANANDSVDIQVNFEILSTQSFKFVNQPVNFSTPRSSDFSRGRVEFMNATLIDAASNTSWVIQVRTSDNSMGQSFDGAYTKSINDLRLRTGTSSYRPISQSEQLISSGRAGASQIPVDYRVMLDGPEQPEGQYNLTLIYTITTR